MRHNTAFLPRIILTLILPVLLGLHASAQSSAEALEPASSIQSAAADIQLSVSRKTVHIRNAQGLTLEVYNLTGVRVLTTHIDSPDKQFTLNLDKGLYLIRIGDFTRKVQLS